LIGLATIPFAIEPWEALSPEEREALAALPGCPSPGPRPFRVRLESRPVWSGADPCPASTETRLQMCWRDRRLRIVHPRFQAEIDPYARTARLFRVFADGYAVTAVLRAALLATLPVEGGLALHSAGLVMGDSGIAFFGPSGAGKSTLAAAAPYAVLSDELVVLSKTAGFRLLPSGFWGTGSPHRRNDEGVPLRALVELTRASTFLLERLPPAIAVRRLLPVATVPPAGCLWEKALGLLLQLVDRTPVYRMGWALPAPPWERLCAELLADGGSTSGAPTASKARGASTTSRT
jgi:hypothetical protein